MTHHHETDIWQGCTGQSNPPHYPRQRTGHEKQNENEKEFLQYEKEQPAPPPG